MTIPWWDDRSLDAVRRIESGGNDRSVTGSNVGPFQFSRDLWSKYGGGGDVYNRGDATAAARREFGDFASAHQRRTGQPMTGDQGYLYHQQGGAGGAALLDNPNMPAWQAVRRFYPSDAVAQKAIWGNVPTDMRSQFGSPTAITAGQFADMWRNKFNRFAGAGGAPLGVPSQPSNDLGDPRWGQLPMMASAREQMPGRMALGGDVPPPEPDYAAPEPVGPPPQPDTGDPNTILPGISMTPPTPAPEPPAPTFQQMGVAPGFQGLPPPDTTSPVQPQPFTAVPGLPGRSVSGEAPRPPITDSGPPPTGLSPAVSGQPGGGMAPPVDKSLAGMLLGPNIAGGIRGIINNEAFRTGLGSLAFGAEGAKAYGGNAIAAQQADIAGRQEARAAETYGRGTLDYKNKLAAFNAAFPEGAAGDPNMKSALLQGLTPGAAKSVASMGVGEAVDWLGKYQLADAEARAKMNRQMEQLDTFKRMAAGQGQAGAPAAAPMPPDVGGLGRPALMPAATGGEPTLPAQTGVNYSRAMAPRAAGVAGPVAAAPGGPLAGPGAMPALPPMGGRGVLPQTPGVVPPTGPEPIVNILGTPMPLSQAEAMVDYMKATGMDTTNEAARIAAARVPQQEYAKTTALKQAEQETGKPQQRQQISGLLDSLDMTRALAAKIKSDKNLPNVLGFYGKYTPDLQPGTQDVSANLDTLLKRTALDTMARLKQQSATGATGFGSTNDKELGIITGALTNLENRFQSPQQYKQNIDTLVTSLDNAERRIRAGWKETFKEPFEHPEGYEPTPYPAEHAAPERSQGRAARAARGLDTRPLTHEGRPVMKVDGKWVDKEEYERATAR